jgi:hypothetical protein
VIQWSESQGNGKWMKENKADVRQPVCVVFVPVVK